MSTEESWDDIPRGGGTYMRWDRVGDKVVGTITARRVGADFNGNPCPEIDVTTDDGEEITVGGGQANLKAQMLDLKPRVDDRISIEFSGEEKAEKGMKKIFTVKVKAAERTPAPAVDDDEF